MTNLPSAAPTRQQFRCLDEIVEAYFFGEDTRNWPPGNADRLKELLRRFGRTVAEEARHAFQKGTERALRQATEVFLDPDYYVVTKKQREASRRKQSAKRKAEREARLRAALEPATPLQIAARRRHLEGMRDWHAAQADCYRKELEAFNADPAKSLTLAQIPEKEMKRA